MAKADLTGIQPISSTAIIFAGAEALASLVILVIFAFSLLTAARDTYRQDFQEFAAALHETVQIIDQRALVKYSLTLEQLEVRVAKASLGTVNLIRKFRGKPPIEVPNTGEDLQDSPAA